MAGKIRYIPVPLDGKAPGKHPRAAAAAGRLAGVSGRLLGAVRAELRRSPPRA